MPSAPAINVAPHSPISRARWTTPSPTGLPWRRRSCWVKNGTHPREKNMPKRKPGKKITVGRSDAKGTGGEVPPHIQAKRARYAAKLVAEARRKAETQRQQDLADERKREKHQKAAE